MKKLISFILVFIIASGVWFVEPMESQAGMATDTYLIDSSETVSVLNTVRKNSDSTKSNKKDNNRLAKKAYKKYFKMNLSDTCDYYILADLNKDGIKEMVTVDASGVRGVMYIYTYYNGKVVKCMDDFVNNVGYRKKGKTFAVEVCGGFDYTDILLCKIKKGKVKVVDTYTYDYGILKKNGKKVSEKEYLKVIWSFDWSRYDSYKMYKG